jgi:hypothetical protein
MMDPTNLMVDLLNLYKNMSQNMINILTSSIFLRFFFKKILRVFLSLLRNKRDIL